MRSSEFLDRPIAFHRCFVTLTGGVTAALMLSQAFYWSKRTKDEGGWFHKSAEEWTDETGLSRHEQDTARAKLRALGFWQEQRKDAPAKLYFRLDIDALEARLGEITDSRLPDSGNLDCRKVENKIAGKRQSEVPESGNLDARKAANKTAEKRQTFLITETTTETTTEITAEKRKQGAKRAQPPQQICDEDFLAGLQANVAYQALDVHHVYAKMVVWCEQKGKQPTRKRLIGWLNSEDRPMTANHNGHANGKHHRTPEQDSAASAVSRFKAKHTI